MSAAATAATAATAAAAASPLTHTTVLASTATLAQPTATPTTNTTLVTSALPKLTIIPPQTYPLDFHSKAVSRSASPSTYRASPVDDDQTPISQFHALRKRYLKNIWDWPTSYLSDPPAALASPDDSAAPSPVTPSIKPLPQASSLAVPDSISKGLSPPQGPFAHHHDMTGSNSTNNHNKKKTLSHPKFSHATLILLGIFSLIFVLSAYLSFFHLHIDPKYSRMSYMSPSFQHISSFNQNYTRLHSKYSLHLYREKHVDATFDGSGIPIIFIPGNAGSYRQVRALAAASSMLYSSHINDTRSVSYEAPKFDFFTVDFQEDLTAFHGKSLSDQAEYLNEAVAFILQMYSALPTHGDLPVPKSVILIGHSMGGVVARTMLTLDNHRKGSVNTIFTLAAPHTLPPVSFDKEIVSIYESVNKYWESSFSQDLIGRNNLAPVSIISITGGSLDHMITSEHTSILSVVPPSNGFTVFSNSIPHVWTGIDHQAVVWCDQFRRVLAQAIHDVADVASPTKTKTLPERMSIFRQHFLGGFDVGAPDYLQRRFHPSVQPLQKASNESVVTTEAFVPPKIQFPDTLLWVKDVTKSTISLGQKLNLKKLGGGAPTAHLLPIPKTVSSDLTFSLLTDNSLLTLDNAGNSNSLPSKPYNYRSGHVPSGLYAMMCRYPFTESKASSANTPLNVIDLTRNLDVDESRLVGLLCKNVARDASKLPLASSPDVPLSAANEFEHLSYLQYDVAQMADYDFLAIVDTNELPTAGFVSAEFIHESDSAIVLRNPLLHFIKGVSVSLPQVHPLMVDISYQSIWSSLLAFHARVVSKSKPTAVTAKPVFNTFVRQYSGDSYDSKYYLNVDDTPLNVSFFGVAPFSPFGVRETDEDFEGNLFYYGRKSTYYHNLHLQVWSDNSVYNGQELKVVLSLDLVGSLGKLVLHYRVALATLPIVIAALVLLVQFRIFILEGVFISFAEGMSIFTRKLLFPLLAFVTGLPFLLQFQFVRDLLYIIEPGMDFMSGDGPESIFTYIRRNQFFLGLEPGHLWFLGAVFIATAVGLCYVVQNVFLLLVHVLACVSSQLPGTMFAMASDAPPTVTTIRRVVATTLLFVAVAFTVPYEFAYVVSFFLQTFTAIRNYSSRHVSASWSNHFNFVFSILMLMFWVALINVPMLAVWVREIATHGQITFRSHHNLFAIGPVVFFVELSSSSRNMLARLKPNCQRLTCELFLGYIAFYALIFGIARAYMIFHLVNLFMAFLVFLTLSDRGMSHLNHMLNGDAQGLDEKQRTELLDKMRLQTEKNTKQQAPYLRRRA